MGGGSECEGRFSRCVWYQLRPPTSPAVRLEATPPPSCCRFPPGLPNRYYEGGEFVYRASSSEEDDYDNYGYEGEGGDGTPEDAASAANAAEYYGSDVE